MTETPEPTPLKSEPANDRFGTRYVVDGDGPWLVLIHGVGLDRTMWSRQSAALADCRRVLRYDMIGHGGTPPAGDPLSLGHFVSQLYELMRLLGIERADIAGFSMGAMVAQAFALKYPAMLRKLAIVSGVYARTDEARAAVHARLRQVEAGGVESTIEASISRWFTRAFRTSHAKEVEHFRNRLDANMRNGFLPAYRVFADADTGLADQLMSIRAPTLVVTGEHDRGSTPEMAKRMSEEISGSTLRLLPRVRHMLPVEAADEFNALLAEFLLNEVERI